MQLLTLQELFGINATQSINALIITKSDLPGLTPLATNRAEQLLVAICLKALGNFQGDITNELKNTISDELGNSIIYENFSAYELLKIFLWEPKYLIKENSLYMKNTIVVEAFSSGD